MPFSDYDDGDDELDWIKDEVIPTSQPVQSNNSGNSNNNSNSNSNNNNNNNTNNNNNNDGPKGKKYVKLLFNIINMGLCILIAATGALGIANASTNTPNAVFIGLYLILFAGVLFIYELVHVVPCCGAIDLYWKKNFGFLYGPLGKSIYTSFIALLSFGIADPAQLATACGVVVMLWSIIQGATSKLAPKYFDVQEKYVPQF